MKVKVKFIDALFKKTFCCSDVEVIKDNYVLFDEDNKEKVDMMIPMMNVMYIKRCEDEDE